MIFKEPHVCRRIVYTVSDADLKEEVKVALTGDWHISSIITDGQRKMLKKTLMEIKPDVIILQGDLFDTPQAFNSPTLIRELKRSLKVCTELAPTLMVIGNHDQLLPGGASSKTRAEFEMKIWPDAVGDWRKLCREAGVKLLIDDWYEVKGVRFFGFFQDAEIYYCENGQESDSFAKMKKKIRRLAEEKILKPDAKKTNWFISHAPIGALCEMKELSKFKVFSFGHTHGGCVPVGLDFVLDTCGFHGGIISPFKKLFPNRFMRGREFLDNGASYIVNTGMVLAQESAPKLMQVMNFIKAAEITEVRIK